MTRKTPQFELFISFRWDFGYLLVAIFIPGKIATSLAGNRTPAAAVKTPNPSH